ncbi:MAG: SusC/RagA family TonB-linked outer membrane protein [Prevotella sp.]|nr:SusC/RagA family TonB-linked outer membrane protein [Prevotella sp.]MBQ6211170.1 SusC/RagA family TonB-linked outer membrane protein [Prevotella sp.]
MKRLYIFLAACSLAASVTAQTAKVKSQIKSTDGEPVSGAIISVIGDSISALSDNSGFFELNANANDALVSIKAEGYYERSLPLRLLVKKQNSAGFVITLTPEDESLYNGKVVTGYGALSDDMKSGITTGIENKDFSDKLSLGAATRDGMAGLQVIEKSGMPGEGTYMNLRGIHSFVAENNPLIVINGVPYLGNQGISDVINGYSRDLLFAYSPKDIRSVTVLKGADAAMYGSLGSNGVVMIETQQATSDNLDTRISFSGQYGFNFKNTSIPMMNSTEYRGYLTDLGMTAYPSMAALTEDYPFLQNNTNIYSYLFNENTNWMKDIQRKGFMTENIFRVEGGDAIAKYNISFGYTNNTGTLRGTGTNRYHTLISSDVMVSRKVDITANVGLAYIKSDLQNTGMQMETNPILAAYHSMPLINAHAKQDDGSLLPNWARYDAWNTNDIPTLPYDNVSNPLAIVNTVEGGDKIYDANAGLGLNFKWNDYLKLSALVNLYYNYTEETMFVPGVTSHSIMPQVYGIGENKVAEGVIRQHMNTYQLGATYNRTFNKIHEFNGLAQARFITRSLEYDMSEGFNTPNDYYKTLGNTNSEKLTTGDNVDWKHLGFTLHGDYIWNKMVKGMANLVVDGSSVTGADATRMGFFPSAGVTFMVANTGILPNAFDKLNVTIEGSLSGNSRFSSNYGKSYYVSNNFFNIGSIVRSNVPNRKLTWEKKRQLDFGLDLSMLHNKFDLGINAYVNESYDLLLSRDISAVYGSKVFYDNTGKISGRGLEVSFRANPIHTKDFDVVVAANISTLKSTIKSLGGDQQNIISYTGYNDDDAQMLMAVDEKPYQFYGFKTAGIYSTTAEAQADGLVNSNGDAFQAGDVKFVDISGPNGTPDGVINEYDKTSLGSSLPTAFGGVNLMLRYKRFTLDANFGYSLGAKLYNATRRQVESMSSFYNQSTAVLDRWQVEGQVASLPRANYGDPMRNNDFSDRWIEDGDFLKLRSLRLSYGFNKLWSFVRSGNVYIAAENLFSITGYLGGDPEFAYSYDERMRGFDYAKVSLPITVKLGFNLNF